MLDFSKTNYSTYSWSLHTLRYFDIKYVRNDIDLGQFEEAIRKEMNGLGRLLGYYCLHKKMHEIYCHNIPRDLVYKIMHQIKSTGKKKQAMLGSLTEGQGTKCFLLRYKSHCDLP